MTKIAIFRCRENETKCPLTNCFLSLQSRAQGFTGYEDAELAGVFPLQDTDEENLNLARILKSKGAESIHFVTCAFSRKEEGKTWRLGDGFCPSIDQLARKIAADTGLICVKGTAHLPENYTPEVFR